ncbi:MAG: UDP-N-acetylmuramoyl-L-alanyl-D-glutamate--2,6-diaminopimelate ligase [Desulfobacterales bacterium]
MKLTRLIGEIPISRVNGRLAPSRDCDLRFLKPDPDITSLHSRAQNVKPGGLFVAIQGFAADGHDYIDQALANGAVAVVVQKPLRLSTSVASIEVEDTRRALAALAASFYGHPSEKLVVVGITGTNGKTTTSYLIERILLQAGYAPGVIGTVNYRYAGETYDNPVTTPESLDLQRILARMLAAGVTHVILEVSSHALDLHRVDDCWMDVGVFTNLSQDHLDYHKDIETYWRCKKSLFTDILRSGPKQKRAAAVINRNDPKGEELVRIVGLKKITVGDARDNTVQSDITKQNLSGIAGRIDTPAGSFDFRSSLVGRYNCENILCAAGVAVALDIPTAAIKAGIESAAVIPGRLEPIPNQGQRFVYVDYAHTPDALRNVLAALTAMVGRRLLCVFGCGGDRDRGKRPQMGKIAAQMCDLAVVTSDNPRSEPPLVIIDQILVGTRQVCRREYSAAELGNGTPEKGYAVEPDRRKAIRLAIAASNPGDTVLIAGKGHETYQILGGKTIAFDDRTVAAQALADVMCEASKEGNPK